MKRWRYLLAVILMGLPLFVWAAMPVSVIVAGIKDDDIIKNVLAALSIQQEKDSPSLTVGRLQRLYTFGADEIKQAVKPFGYYHAKVEENLTQENHVWVARFVVSLGTPVRIISRDLELRGSGKQDPEIVVDFNRLPLFPGNILNQAIYESYKGSVLRVADERGYFDARFITHEIYIDVENNTAKIKLVFDTGERYRFGNVTYDQNIFSKNFLQRFQNFKTGDPYDNQKLLELQNNLSNNNYFTHVTVMPDKEHMVNHEVPIMVTLKPRKNFKYTLGMGFGTDTGLRGGLGWEWRRINQYGHHFETDVKVSEYINRAEARYVIPGRNPTLDQYILSTGVISEDPPERNLKSTTQHAGVSQVHMSADNKWQRTISLNYQIEKYENPDETRISRLLIPGVIWQYTNADDRFNPTRGYQVRLDLHGASPLTGSSANIIQTQISGKYLLPLGTENALILRGDLGLTHWNEREDIPLSLRYFTGGDNSVRGYAYQALGPKAFDENGKKVVIGGPFLEVASIEFDRHLFGKWTGAVFFDTGNAMNHLSDPLKRSVGFGVRYQTPVGPIRVDMARAIDERGKPWRLHFSVGPNL